MLILLPYHYAVDMPPPPPMHIPPLTTSIFPLALSPDLSNKTNFVSPGIPQPTFSNTFRKEHCTKGVINC